jgi:hypothetical protein
MFHDLGTFGGSTSCQGLGRKLATCTFSSSEDVVAIIVNYHLEENFCLEDFGFLPLQFCSYPFCLQDRREVTSELQYRGKNATSTHLADVII